MTAPDLPGGAPLLDFHLHQLRQSAISDEVIGKRGYRSVSRPSAGDDSSRDMLRRLGIPAWARSEDARFPGLLIPLYRVTGELVGWQYRPDAPAKDPKTGKVRRYAAQAGRPNVLDVHPLNRNRIADLTVPLWITEGIKKADSLTSLGQCAIALSGVFNWRSRLGTLGDWEDVPLRGRQVNVCFDADIRENKSVGRAMERLGNWLKSKGAGPVVYVVPPGVNGIVHKGVDDFFAAGGTLELLWSGASTSPPVTAPDMKVDPDGYMVETLAEDVFDGRYLWSPGLGWLRYGDSDGRWKQVSDVVPAEETRKWLIAKHQDALAALNEAARRGAPSDDLRWLEQIAASWRQANTTGRITSLSRLARGLVLKDVTDFDAYPDLLNCPNGVLDLRTGELGAHDPDLLLTKVTRARYGPGTTHPDVTMALDAIPEGARDYAQLRMGQAITGHKPPDDVIFFLVGGGENGKTTIMYGVSGAIGDYFALVSERAITADKSQHPTELMDFRGARLAVLEELTEGRWLNVRRLKIITGEQITARYCGQNDVTFACTHALYVSSNYLPVVAETDHGTWRRLLLLAFPFTFRKRHEMTGAPGEREGNPGLRERVHAGDGGQREAFLAWLAEGARKWYAGEPGVREPLSMGESAEHVREGTRAWRDGASPLAEWASERLTEDGGWHAMSSDLYGSFSEHLRATGHQSWSENVFTARLSEYFGAKITKQRIRAREDLSRPVGYEYLPLPQQYVAWLGIRFKTDAEMLADSEKPLAVQGVQPHLAVGSPPGLSQDRQITLHALHSKDPRAYWQALFRIADFGGSGDG